MRKPFKKGKLFERQIHIEDHRLITRRLSDKIKELEAVIAIQKQEIANLERDNEELRKEVIPGVRGLPMWE